LLSIDPAMGKAYVATANHVVRRHDFQTGQDQVADEVKVTFKALPGEPFVARVTDQKSLDLDLAVLDVDLGPRAEVLAKAGIPSAILADTDMLERGTDLQYIGQPGGKRWHGNVKPVGFRDFDGSLIVFESGPVEAGASGGGLFDAEGQLAGMVTSVSTAEGRAVRIETVIQTAKRWAFPVDLTYPADPQAPPPQPKPVAKAQPKKEDEGNFFDRLAGKLLDDAEDVVDDKLGDAEAGYRSDLAAATGGAEPNDSPQAAFEIAGTASYVDSLGFGDDEEDWFVVVPPRNGTLAVTVENTMERGTANAYLGTVEVRIGITAIKVAGYLGPGQSRSKSVAVSQGEPVYIKIRQRARGENRANYRIETAMGR
jgi:hypothetical protein